MEEVGRGCRSRVLAQQQEEADAPAATAEGRMRTHVHSLRVADGSDALATRAPGAPKNAARSRSSCAGAARPAWPPGTRAQTLLHTVTGSSPRSCAGGGGAGLAGRNFTRHIQAAARSSSAPRALPLDPPQRATARPGPRRWQGHPPGHRRRVRKETCCATTAWFTASRRPHLGQLHHLGPHDAQPRRLDCAPHVAEDASADAGSRDEAEAALAAAPEGFSRKVVLVARHAVLAAISVEGAAP